MLAVDTNIIIRYLIGDHPQQSAKVRKLFDENDIFVCTTVLLEAEWVLRSVYGFKLVQIVEAFSGIAGLPRVTLQEPAVANALDWVRQGADFADAIHFLTSRGCDAFLTFDTQFAKTMKRSGEMQIRTL
ncbi:MAG TPA: type II toxin-antitoxin system VapC family toxin [Rhizomicrobium sp.]|jgi:predicted nucleic-acid-binding protein|nr:type II toxin-antitoxin system VapC family toxin [Rhizomicrobium sp.]